MAGSAVWHPLISNYELANKWTWRTACSSVTLTQIYLGLKIVIWLVHLIWFIVFLYIRKKSYWLDIENHLNILRQMCLNHLLLLPVIMVIFGVHDKLNEPNKIIDWDHFSKAQNSLLGALLAGSSIWAGVCPGTSHVVSMYFVLFSNILSNTSIVLC